MGTKQKFDNLQNTIAALSEGSVEAFDALYHRYVGKVYNFIRNISGDIQLTEDITQEVFIKLWRKREELDPGRNIESWLFICAKNLFLNELRSRKQSDAFAAESKHSSNILDNSTLDLINYHFAESAMAEIIREMPPQRQKIFVLSRLYGLPAAEIARQMGISERTVENQLYQAKKYLSSMEKYKS